MFEHTVGAATHSLFTTNRRHTNSPCTSTASSSDPPPPLENIYAVQETTVLGVENSTDNSPNDHPGAIWLSPGLVEMSEPEEGTSREAIATGLLQCDTSSTDYNKPYGWKEGTNHSTDVSDTRKHRKKRHTNPPPPHQKPTHNHKPPGVVLNWSALQCSKAKH